MLKTNFWACLVCISRQQQKAPAGVSNLHANCKNSSGAGVAARAKLVRRRRQEKPCERETDVFLRFNCQSKQTPLKPDNCRRNEKRRASFSGDEIRRRFSANGAREKRFVSLQMTHILFSHSRRRRCWNVNKEKNDFAAASLLALSIPFPK